MTFDRDPDPTIEDVPDAPDDASWPDVKSEPLPEEKP